MPANSRWDLIRRLRVSYALLCMVYLTVACIMCWWERYRNKGSRGAQKRNNFKMFGPEGNVGDRCQRSFFGMFQTPGDWVLGFLSFRPFPSQFQSRVDNGKCILGKHNADLFIGLIFTSFRTREFISGIGMWVGVAEMVVIVSVVYSTATPIIRCMLALWRWN